MPKLWEVRAAWRARHRVGDQTPLSFAGDRIRPMADPREGIAKDFRAERAKERRKVLDNYYVSSSPWRQD
jgi:hypothetical protein